MAERSWRNLGPVGREWSQDLGDDDGALDGLRVAVEQLRVGADEAMEGGVGANDFEELEDVLHEEEHRGYGAKDEEELERPLSELPIGGAEADDEDEEEYERRHHPDSGVGTSYSVEGAAQLRRRPSRH